MSAPPRPLRVLIVAEHASARFGGEAALPLHYFRVLKKMDVPVWLVTHARTREELRALYPGDPSIHYVEDTAWHRALWRISRFLPSRVSSFSVGFASRVSTQLAARRIVRRLVAEHGIDVVHQPMPVSPREPSLMHGLGAPVVIGPMNGGMDYPPAFRRRDEGALQRAIIGAARASADLMNRLAPGKRKASRLLVANARTRAALPSCATPEVVEIVENGVDFGLWRAADEPAVVDRDLPNGPVTWVFMGRLVDWKAVDLLLRAFAAASRAVPMRLRILGDGDQRPALEALADRLGVSRDARSAGGVEFAGWRSQADCAMALRHADGLVLTSLLECGGAVVLEAMALGKPVIATAWGGPLDYLDDTCGVLVEPTSPHALVEAFADAMAELARSPERRQRLGRAGAERTRREFDWDAKVRRVMTIYADVASPPRARSADCTGLTGAATESRMAP